MHARYYIIQAEEQEIVLQKNSINPALYWGQHMALESLEKGSLSVKTTCFARPIPMLENPYAGINRLPNSIQPNIQRTAPASDPHNVFRPFASSFNQHQMNINLKRKFKGVRQKSASSKFQNASFDYGREPTMDSNKSIQIESKDAPSENAFFLTNLANKEEAPMILDIKPQNQTKFRLRTASPDTFKFPKNLKNQSFEGFLREVNVKLQEYEPILQARPKSNARPKSIKLRPKYTLVDMTKNITPLQNKRRLSDTLSDGNINSSHTLKKENRQVIGGLRPFSLGSKMRRNDDIKNDGANTLVSSTELDSLDNERNSPSAHMNTGSHSTGKEPLVMKNVLLISEPHNQSLAQPHTPSRFHGHHSPKQRNIRSQERKHRAEINHSHDVHAVDEGNERDGLRLKAVGEQIKIAENNIAADISTTKRPSFVRKKYSAEMVGGKSNEKEL